MKHSQQKCPVTSVSLSVPKPLPPLVSLRTRVTMDPSVRLPSTWRDPIGSVLTDRRITEYQQQGRLGGDPKKLPPLTGPRCRECNGLTNVKHRDYSYLPHIGYWCELCLDKHRASRDREKELGRLVRERRRSYE